MYNILVLAKPDAVHNGHVGRILTAFESNHFWVRNSRQLTMDAEWCAEHYCKHVEQPYYEALCAFMCSGPSIAFNMQYVMRDRQMIVIARQLVAILRPTTPGPANLVHASDSEAEADRELQLWFGDDYGT